MYVCVAENAELLFFFTFFLHLREAFKNVLAEFVR